VLQWGATGAVIQAGQNRTVPRLGPESLDERHTGCSAKLNEFTVFRPDGQRTRNTFSNVFDAAVLAEGLLFEIAGWVLASNLLK
jgi:hypothetical protein